ncbi:hypothetical protein ALI144C_22485 [Actinosynnema sp. ALI-1.44]|nr:hypothetical protein ALI144C_22485 [Actinosynnema sp. ALI-1.44]
MSPGPPIAKRVDDVVDLHGERRNDPYAWMRDHDAPDFVAYLRDERSYYDSQTLRSRKLVRDLVSEALTVAPTGYAGPPRLLGCYEYSMESVPKGGRHRRLVQRRTSDGTSTVALDLNEMASGGEFIRLGLCEPSPDGRWLAYSVDTTGGEAYVLRFRDLRSGRDLDVRFERTYYGSAWSADSREFYFTEIDDCNRPFRAYRYRPGDDGPGVLVHEERERSHHVHLRLTRSRDWVVVSSANRDTSEQRVIPATASGGRPMLIKERRRGLQYFVEHVRGASGGEFIILTNDGAPEFRVMAAPVASPDRSAWREVVPARDGVRISRVDVFSEGMVLSCRQDDARQFLEVVIPGGRSFVVSPDTAAGDIFLDLKTPYESHHVDVISESMIHPPRRWSVDLRSGERRVVHRGDSRFYSADRYVTSRLWARSADGVEVPVTIAHRSDVVPDGTNPCHISVYGAYEVSKDPAFDPVLVSLLNRGFVCAIAHVRGGGERGRRWWLDGRLNKKVNSIADLVAVRDHLVSEGWAAPDGVVCEGLCAGGIVVSSVYTAYADRWAGVVAEAPAVDILNSMLDPGIPLTPNEWDEYGDPRDRTTYDCMRSYVAYECVSDAPRPPLLVTATYRDPRVMVDKPAKWVAALRHADSHGNRILLRAELSDGAHQGPATYLGKLSFRAELLAFLLETVRGHWESR